MFTDRSAMALSTCVRLPKWRRFALLFYVLALVAMDAGAADRFVASDRQAIETTIRRQLEAFGRDDAKAAFAYATPDIQRLFGSSDNFMSTVRESYEPVYRAVDPQFIRLDVVDGDWVQTVQLVDGEGRVWRALFTMKRQADRTWKVGGCQLVQTKALAT